MVDPESGTFEVYARDSQIPGSLSSNQVCTIFEDSRHQIWIGTLGGGINLYQPEKDNFLNITRKEGLASNVVYGFLEDNNGDLWISTNNGISRYINGLDHSGTSRFLNYDVSDGLQGNEFSPQSALKTRNGMMFFGGLNGFNYFNPDSIVENLNRPKVVFTDFRIFNKSVGINTPGSPLTKPIDLTSELF